MNTKTPPTIEELQALLNRGAPVPTLRSALEALLNRHVNLVQDTGAGGWDAEIETEVIDARAALSGLQQAVGLDYAQAVGRSLRAPQPVPVTIVSTVPEPSPYAKLETALSALAVRVENLMEMAHGEVVSPISCISHDIDMAATYIGDTGFDMAELDTGCNYLIGTHRGLKA